MNQLRSLKAWVGTAATSMVLTFASTMPSQALDEVSVASSFKAITPVAINLIMAEEMGYAAEDNLKISLLPLGSLAAATAQVELERAEFRAGAPPSCPGGTSA